jgi:hypothetical protein
MRLFQGALVIQEEKPEPEHPVTIAIREHYDDLLLNMKREGDSHSLLDHHV